MGGRTSAQSDRLTPGCKLLALQILPLRGEVTLRPFTNSGTGSEIGNRDPLRTCEQGCAGIRSQPPPPSLFLRRLRSWEMRTSFLLFSLPPNGLFQPHLHNSYNAISMPFWDWTSGCLQAVPENFFLWCFLVPCSVPVFTLSPGAPPPPPHSSAPAPSLLRGGQNVLCSMALTGQMSLPGPSLSLLFIGH